MLVLFFEWLSQTFSFFDVFKYLTLRGILAVLTALGMCLAMGPLMIRRLTELKIGQSIRDDGPLPEVITDALEAQREMRKQIQDVSFCLMIATTLHSIAVGNLLPASVGVVCVDINPSTVIKLSDRGSFQTVGLVTDVEPFLRGLVADLQASSA